jgi:hypothetical protein
MRRELCPMAGIVFRTPPLKNERQPSALCGCASGSRRLLARRPTANPSSEFLSLVGDVAADLFPTFRSKEDSKSDADADSQEQRHCRAKTRTILPGDGPRGSPDAPARDVAAAHMKACKTDVPIALLSADDVMSLSSRNAVDTFVSKSGMIPGVLEIVDDLLSQCVAHVGNPNPGSRAAFHISLRSSRSRSKSCDSPNRPVPPPLSCDAGARAIGTGATYRNGCWVPGESRKIQSSPPDSLSTVAKTL